MSDNQPPTINVPPGWYPDPTGHQRWWDGTQWGVYATKTKLSGVALAGFICSCVGVAASYGPTVILVVVVAGIVMSGVGLSQTKHGYRGRGFAIAGMVLGCVAILLLATATVTRIVSA